MDANSESLHFSQDEVFSLRELDPAPMEENAGTQAASSEKEFPPLPDGTSEDIVTTGKDAHFGLSASKVVIGGQLRQGGHGALYYLSRLQRLSSYSFSLFAVIHLGSTSIIPLVTQSVSASEEGLMLAREIYQTPLSEPLLVFLPIFAHVASGVAVRLLKRAEYGRRKGGGTPGLLRSEDRGSQAGHATSPWPTLSYISASGYVLVAAVGGHVYLTRGLPLLVEGDSSNMGLAYVAHGFARWPLVATTAYAGLVAVAAGHMSWGWASWIGLAQRAAFGFDRGHETNAETGKAETDRTRRRLRRKWWLAINGVASAVGLLWAAGGLGIVARGGRTEGWVGRLYDGLYETVLGLGPMPET